MTDPDGLVHQSEQTILVRGMGPFNLTVNVVRVPATNITEANHPLLAAAVEERSRQIEMLGHDNESDDAHEKDELIAAAICYLIPPNRRRQEIKYGRKVPTFWPFTHRDWKPKDRRQDLIRVVALVMAEYDRLDRAGEIDE